MHFNGQWNQRPFVFEQIEDNLISPPGLLSPRKPFFDLSKFDDLATKAAKEMSGIDHSLPFRILKLSSCN